MGELKQVDPWNLRTSSLNERQHARDGDHDIGALKQLEESVARVGVLEPPIVRKIDVENMDGVDSVDELDVTYETIIGQRRMIAAQNAELDSIPVIVVEWDDADALESSIVENIDAFQEKVGPKDRAIAVYHLKQMKGWTQGDVAEHLNVSQQIVSKWLEYFKDEWKGTIIHGGEGRIEKQSALYSELNSESVNKIPINAITTIRRSTGGGKDGVKACELVLEHDLSERDVQCARGIKDDDPSVWFIDALQQVAEQKHSDGSGSDDEPVDDDGSDESVDESDDADTVDVDTGNHETDETADTDSVTEESGTSTDTTTTSNGDSERSSSDTQDSVSDTSDTDSSNSDRMTIREVTFDERTSQQLDEQAKKNDCSPKQFVINAVLDKIDNEE